MSNTTPTGTDFPGGQAGFAPAPITGWGAPSERITGWGTEPITGWGAPTEQITGWGAPTEPVTGWQPAPPAAPPALAPAQQRWGTVVTEDQTRVNSLQPRHRKLRFWERLRAFFARLFGRRNKEADDG